MKNVNEYRNMFTVDRTAARETVARWRDAIAALENQQTVDNLNGETPAHTVKCFVSQVGEELARFVIASLVNNCSWDGRIFPSVKAWAADQEDALDEETSLEARIYTNMHRAHLNQIAEAMMQYQPEPEEEKPAEEVTLDQKAREYFEIQQQIAELEALAEAIKDAMKAAMVEAGKEELDGIGWRCTWHNTTTNRFDSAGFKKAHGDLYSEFCKPVTGTRFTLNQIKAA